MRVLKMPGRRRLVVVAAAIVEPGYLLAVSKKDALACSAAAAGSFTGLGLRP